MKKQRIVRGVTVQSVRKANSTLKLRGLTVGRSAVTGTMTINIVRGTLDHHRLVSKEEMTSAFKKALVGNV